MAMANETKFVELRIRIQAGAYSEFVTHVVYGTTVKEWMAANEGWIRYALARTAGHSLCGDQRCPIRAADQCRRRRVVRGRQSTDGVT